MIERLDSMKVGKEVLFSGGIKGKITKVGEEYLNVEVSKGVEFTISKLAVSEVLSNKKAKYLKTGILAGFFQLQESIACCKIFLSSLFSQFDNMFFK